MVCEVDGCNRTEGVEEVSGRLGRQKVQLCPLHRASQSTRRICPGCEGIVLVGKHTVLAHVPRTVGRVVCADCEKRTVSECPGCGRVVRIGLRDVPGEMPVKVDTFLLCPGCAADRQTCFGCERLLRAGGRRVRAAIVHVGSPVDICEPCDGNTRASCGACGVPTLVEYRRNAFRWQPMSSGVRRHDTTTTLVVAAKTPVTDYLGTRCAECSTGALSDPGGASGFYQAANAWLARWIADDTGSRCDPFDGRLTYSFVAEGSTWRGEGEGRRIGSCVTTPDDTTVRRKQHTVTVLRHMPPVAFQATVVHELAHAWTRENGLGKRRLIEGFCQLVSYLFLKDMAAGRVPGGDREVAMRLMERMEANDDQIYGIDFLKMRNATRGVDVVRWLRGNGDRIL